MKGVLIIENNRLVPGEDIVVSKRKWRVLDTEEMDGQSLALIITRNSLFCSSLHEHNSFDKLSELSVWKYLENFLNEVENNTLNPESISKSEKDIVYPDLTGFVQFLPFNISELDCGIHGGSERKRGKVLIKEDVNEMNGSKDSEIRPIHRIQQSNICTVKMGLLNETQFFKYARLLPKNSGGSWLLKFTNNSVSSTWRCGKKASTNPAEIHTSMCEITASRRLHPIAIIDYTKYINKKDED